MSGPPDCTYEGRDSRTVRIGVRFGQGELCRSGQASLAAWVGQVWAHTGRRQSPRRAVLVETAADAWR